MRRSSVAPQRNQRRHRSERRVAFFTGNYETLDGVTVILDRLVSFLEARGAKVLVFAPPSGRGLGRTDTLVPVPSIPIPIRPEYRITLGISRSARRRLAEFNPSLIHILAPDRLGSCALRLGERWGVPVVSSYHTHFSSYLRFYHLEPFQSLLWWYLRRFYGRCEQVYAVSPSIARVLEARGVGGQLRIWDGGVDPADFSPRRRSSGWRRARGVGDGEALVSFVGRIVKEKRLDTLVRVMRALEERGVPHRSMVVGYGPELAKLERHLPNTIFTGFLSGESLSNAYASSDVLLFPSDTETFGMCTLEAMASGVPSVCADAPGSQSLVVDGVTGFLVQAEDVKAFVDRCSLLVSDAALRSRMGAAARERALPYRWENVLGRMLSYYDEILGVAAPATRFESVERADVPEPIAE